MRCWRVSCETVCARCCSVLCYWRSLHFNPGTDCLKSDSSAMPITPSPPQTQIKRFCFGGRNDLFPGAVKTNTTKMKMDSRWSQFITHYINETKSLNSHVKSQKVKKVEVKEEEQHHQPSVDAPHDYECVSIVWHTHTTWWKKWWIWLISSWLVHHSLLDCTVTHTSHSRDLWNDAHEDLGAQLPRLVSENLTGVFRFWKPLAQIYNFAVEIIWI